jgi:hypothetical protein
MKSAQEMVRIITEALQTNPAGIVSTTIDGIQTSWDRKDLRDELDYWKRLASQEAGRPTLIPVYFS